jgi:hypothetical protein
MQCVFVKFGAATCVRYVTSTATRSEGKEPASTKHGTVPWP